MKSADPVVLCCDCMEIPASDQSQRCMFCDFKRRRRGLA